MDQDQFVVVKFINEDDIADEDDSCFEVGLTKWLIGELDDKMKTTISWPPKSMQSISLKKQIDSSSSWPKYNVVVLKFYNTLLAARNGLNGFLMSSNYETDVELGRGKRKKIERQPFSFDSLHTQTTQTINAIQSDSSDSNPDDPGTSQFTSKTNVAAPPLVCYKPQTDETESQKIIKHGKNNIKTNIKTNILEKKQLKKPLLMSLQNKRSRKEILLAKINEAKKTSVRINRSEIIEAARQRQQKSDIKEQLESSSAIFLHDDMMSQNVTKCDKKSVHDILQPNTSMEVQNKKKFKKNQSFSVSSDNDILYPKTCTKTLETVNMSKENISAYTSDTEPIENSSSVHPQSDCELSPLNIDNSHQIKELRTPLSARQSGNLSQTLSEIRNFQKKAYIQNQEISSKLDIVIMNVTRLNHFLLPNERRIIRPIDLPSLPLMTEEELEKFETFLSKNDNITSTIYYMSQIIGSKDNVKEATYKVLKKLISNTLASEFNLKGGGNPSKKSFQKLTLYEVVEGAILNKNPEAELVEIAVATSS